MDVMEDYFILFTIISKLLMSLENLVMFTMELKDSATDLLQKEDLIK